LRPRWPQIARQRGLKTVLKVDDMYFYCRKVHLAHRDGSACSGPESLDKCHDCSLAGRGPAPAEDIASSFHLLAYRRALLREVFAGFDFVHTPSRFLERTHRQYGFDNPRLEVLPTGIQPFPVPPKVPDPGGRQRVTFLGNLERRKGILVFLRAVELYQAQLRERRKQAALRFAIHGGHFKDQLSQEVLRRVEQLEDTEYRGGFGPEDRGRIFAATDLAAMPSIGENYPFIIREALFAGVPVVATAIAGVPEIIAPGRNGFLVPPGDVGALVAVFWALQEDAGLLETLDATLFRPLTIEEDAVALSGRFIELVG
jgi:glycosyltransferase involved in cell wall biosynthesis